MPAIITSHHSATYVRGILTGGGQEKDERSGCVWIGSSEKRAGKVKTEFYFWSLQILFIYQLQAAENCERQQTTTTDRKTACLSLALQNKYIRKFVYEVNLETRIPNPFPFSVQSNPNSNHWSSLSLCFFFFCIPKLFGCRQSFLFYFCNWWIFGFFLWIACVFLATKRKIMLFCWFQWGNR